MLVTKSLALQKKLPRTHLQHLFLLIIGMRTFSLSYSKRALKTPLIFFPIILPLKALRGHRRLRQRVGEDQAGEGEEEGGGGERRV